MTRNGKIARLPYPIREQLNQRVQNGEKARRILPWLNALPEVVAVMKADFDGKPVTDANLANWKQAGYLDWKAELPARAAIQSLIERSDSLKDDVSDDLHDRMSVLLSARIAAQLIQTDPAATSSKESQALGELLIRFARLRRGEANAKRLAIEQQRLELLRRRKKEELDEQFWEWSAREENRAKICKGRCYTEAEKRRRTRFILGLPPLEEDKPPAAPPDSATPEPDTSNPVLAHNNNAQNPGC